MTNEQQHEGPEAGATEEGIALHGDEARAETHEQPETVELPAGTLIAKGDEGDDSF